MSRARTLLWLASDGAWYFQIPDRPDAREPHEFTAHGPLSSQDRAVRHLRAGFDVHDFDTNTQGTLDAPDAPEPTRKGSHLYSRLSFQNN